MGCGTQGSGLGHTVLAYRLGSVTAEVFSNLSDSVVFKQLHCSRKEGCSSLDSLLFKYKNVSKCGRQEKDLSIEAGLLEY